jgi:hypothetical protein
MGILKTLRSVGVAVVALLVTSLITAGAALAEAPTTICVPEHASSQVLSTNAKGECPAKVISKTTVKYKSEPLPGTAELEKLDKLLPHVNYVESGVGGRPTIQFSGVNVQIVDGEGSTFAVNGSGNLVIGYDEGPGTQSGSHNLVLGTSQTFTSYGGIDAGAGNTISAPYASITGGSAGLASGQAASVTGGFENKATGTEASVSGGGLNVASFKEASVSGGFTNTASGENASIGGGENNKATATFAWVGGGFRNTVSGFTASIFGGFEHATSASYEAIP